MRGKEASTFDRSAPAGITPAYAGKSPHRLARLELHRDHPRVCGEKTTLKSGEVREKGSPPRMRGKGIWSLP